MSDLQTDHPLEGKTSIDDRMFCEPERLSYRAAARLAAAVSAAIAGTVKDKEVVIANTALLVDLFNLDAVMGTLGRIGEDYKSLTGILDAKSMRGIGVVDFTAALVAPAVISGVTTALGILSFFREDVDYRGIRTVVDPLAFELALAGELKAAGAATNVYVADLFVPNSGPSNLATQLGSTHRARTEAWQRAAPTIAKMARLDADLSRAAHEGAQKEVDRLAAEIAEVRRNLDPLTEPLSQLDRRFDDLESTLNRTDEKTGLTVLARLLRAEAIREAATPSGVYVHAAVVSSGGHHRISRNLLRLLFFGDGLSFMGGAVIRWAVVDGSGAIAKAGIKDLSLSGRFKRPSPADSN